MPKNKLFSDGSSNYPYPHRLPPFMYHGTLGSKVESIMTRGLEPRGSGAASDDAVISSVREYVYLGTRKLAANHICRVMEWKIDPRKRITDNVLILRVDTSFLNKRLLRPDEDWCTSLWDADSPEDREYPNEEEEMIAGRGELVEWARRCWYDSLVEDDSVAYRGAISAEAITVIASDEWDRDLQNLRYVYAQKYLEMIANKTLLKR